MAIEFVNSTLVVSGSSIQIKLRKTNASNQPVSANVLLSGADALFPAAQQYNGIKAQVVWTSGDQGEKTVSIPSGGDKRAKELVV